MPADLLGQPDLPQLPGPPSPAVFPVRARPPGPGRVARRAGLVGCYEHVRRHPAECAGCGVVRPLIGSSEEGRPVCGPCAGAPGLDYTCRECGRGGEIHSGRRCFRCVLAERTQTLLAGPGRDVSVQFQPLLEALTSVTNPATVVKWLGTSRSARLLGNLARTGDPITHELLDGLPQNQSLRYVREVLVSSGVLAARNEHLERLAPWLEHVLHDKPAHHARLVRPFMHWFVLRRARRNAARRTFTRGSADFARARVLVALDLLSWLDHRGHALSDLTQADLDRWLADGTTTRRAVRYFLQWARRRGLAGDLTVPLPPRQEPARLLAEGDHIQQLDRCLTDETMPLDLRAGGALVLLFGMLVSRITQLTKDDVIEDGQATWLAIDGHRLMLPPRLAHLVRRLRDQDEPRWTLGRLGTPVPWLFPGQSPARPAVDILFGVRLHRYGIDAHSGRNTGRLALAAELPASVLADLTGISISTAERWSQWAQRDWTTYIGQRAADIAAEPRKPSRAPQQQIPLPNYLIQPSPSTHQESRDHHLPTGRPQRCPPDAHRSRQASQHRPPTHPRCLDADLAFRRRKRGQGNLSSASHRWHSLGQKPALHRLPGIRNADRHGHPERRRHPRAAGIPCDIHPRPGRPGPCRA